MQDSVGVYMYCAEVKIPPFTKGKKTLESDTARQLSRARIHVERTIGSLRQKYCTLFWSQHYH